MGQIIGSAAKPKRCNIQSLSDLGTPDAGQYILVSSDNSMQSDGQGNFDCYIKGDGHTVATSLTLHYLEQNLIDDEKVLAIALERHEPQRAMCPRDASGEHPPKKILTPNFYTYGKKKKHEG